jgi:xylulokinase
MDMAKYLIGIDSGTTGVKSKIYDIAGNIIAEGYQEYECVFVKPGWVDQDINMLLDAVYNSLADVTAKAKQVGIDLGEIAAIGLATQRITHFYMDRDGKVLRGGMGISWQDTRCVEEAEWMRGFAGEYTGITGLPVSEVWGSGKIKWIMNHEPETYEKTYKILTTQEFFLYHLGAKDGWFQDWSNASQFGMIDIEKMEFSDPLFKKFGVDKDKMPKLVGSGWKVGVLDKYSSERTGLPEGIPLCTGGGDQQCAAVGAGVIREGLCEVTLGTAGVSIVALDSPKRDPNGIVSLSAHAFPEKAWESEGLQNAAASSYRWFRDNIGWLMKLIEPASKTDPYVMMGLHAQAAPVGSNGLIFAPYLSGSVCPNYDGAARGAFLGLSFKSDFGCLARSVMEGVAYETKSVLEAFDAFVDYGEVMLSGGATKSPLWCQIQTDIYNRPSAVLRETECTVLGAAILGGYGAGVFKSMQEGVEMMVSRVKQYTPIQENVKRYGELFELFKIAYASLSKGGFYKGLHKYTEENVR